MDNHTLEKLEFQRVREMLAVHAQCALGRHLAMRIRPSRAEHEVRLWLEQSRQFAGWVGRAGLPPMGGISDVRDMVRRAVPPEKLEPEEFADLASTLLGVDAVRRYLRDADAEFEELLKLGARLGDFTVIAERIGRVVDSRGKVRDDASERLERVRGQIEETRSSIKGVFDHLLKQSHILRLLAVPNAMLHNDRTVLPFKADQRERIPGIVHRSSDSGHTLFVEPAEAVELNNTLINLRQSEQEEINRILWELTHLVHLNQREILRTMETLAILDLLAAKFKFAEKYEMRLPEINGDRQLKFFQARNPILMSIFEQASGDGPRRKVVPIDVRLGDDFDVMMVTGPNTGGKTAALKTVGLLVLMVQAGLPIPVGAGSTMPVFSGVWIDVGDEQSLQQSLSTFSAHLGRILDILQKVRRDTLVLLDELGAGTDPDEGAAIGRAIIDQLREARCLAMVTTHLGALKALGYEGQRVDNAAVQFDIASMSPTYVLRIGEPGNSNAIDIAARLGMPRKLVMSARKHLAGGHRALNRAISGTFKARREAERARLDAERARQDAAKQTLSALDKARVLQEAQKAYAAWVERIRRLQPGEEVHVRRFDKMGRVVRVRFEKQQASVDLGTMEVEVDFIDLGFVGGNSG